MQRFLSLFAIGAVVLASFCPGWAAEDEWKAPVQTVLDKYTQWIEAEDLDRVMEFYHPEYSFAFANLAKDKMREQIQGLFKDYDALDLNMKVLQMERQGRYIVVITEAEIKGRPVAEQNAAVKTISKNTVADLLVEENGALLYYMSVVIEPKGMAKIHGNQYKNETIGISFTIPTDWVMLPASHPSIMEVIFFVTPQGKSGGMYGYLELPYEATPQQAVEGDENMLKRIAGDSYKEILAREVEFKGNPGYESISEFAINKNPKQKRQRLYFAAGGLLHIFTMDVVPVSEWDPFSKQFQSILDSFTLTPVKGNEASQRARQEHASGSIVGDVYMNNEVGCQVAAPQGWDIESTNLGGGSIFSVNIKPAEKTDSLVRLIAWPSNATLKIETLIDEQVKSYKMVGKDVVTSPSQPIQIGSLSGYSAVTEFTIEGFRRFKRNTVMFIAKDKLFAFLCDAIPPSEYEKLEPKFNEIIQSFSLN
ncbi:MAG: hypothetical protein RBU29_10020 [bacterium]|jgi:hypothetical protein|nr:hypothetical protein [bacterium]